MLKPLFAALLLACSAAHAAAPAVAARYLTTECAVPCAEPAQHPWLFWRSENRIEIRDAAGQLGELWTRDARGRVSYVYLEPAQQRGIAYNTTDLKLAGHKRGWEQLAGMIAPDELAGLAAAGETTVNGRTASLYRGKRGDADLEVAWSNELQLALRIVVSHEGRRSVTEWQGEANAAPTADSQLAAYDLVDFADLGDMETSPDKAWLKQVRAAPGQDAHEHAH